MMDEDCDFDEDIFPTSTPSFSSLIDKSSVCLFIESKLSNLTYKFLVEDFEVITSLDLALKFLERQFPGREVHIFNPKGLYVE